MRSIAEIDRDHEGMGRACVRPDHGCTYPACECDRSKRIVPNVRGIGGPGTPAHSKSEYKRRVALGDPNVLPPDWHAEWGKPWTALEALQYANMLLAQRGTSDSRIDAVLAGALGVGGNDAGK